MELKRDLPLPFDKLPAVKSPRDDTIDRDRDEPLNLKLLSVYELMEDHRTGEIAPLLLVGECVARSYIDDILEETMDKITEKEFRKKVPVAVVENLQTYLMAGLSLHFKEYDQDDEKLLRRVTEPDDEPKPIPIDTWGRANLSLVKPASKPSEVAIASLKIPDYRENLRKEIKIAAERALKYLTDTDETRMPNPIPLNEKQDDIAAEEIEVRQQKERQFKEKKEKDKKEREEQEKQKQKEKLFNQAAKNAGGEGAMGITYSYEGEPMVQNFKAVKDKLIPFVLPTKITLKNAETEKTETETVLKARAKEQQKDKVALPGLKKPAKVLNIEDLMNKANQSNMNLNEVISLASGVTLIQNGRTKANLSRTEHRFNQTGTVRMNKTDYGRLLEQKKILKEKRLAEMKRDQRGFGKKKDQKRAAIEEPAENTKKVDQSDNQEEELGLDSKTMKISSLKQLRALRDLATPDQTMTSFNHTQATEAAKRAREQLKATQDRFIQSNTDTFNLEIMRGASLGDTLKGKMSSTQVGALKPGLSQRQLSKQPLEDKLQPLPRNRSQKVLKGRQDELHFMTPPSLGGPQGHVVYTSKTTQHFFKSN